MSISGWATFNYLNWDSKGNGSFIINKDSKDNKIEYQVAEDGTIDIEYNDVIRGRSSTDSLRSALNELTYVTDDNLLYIYLNDLIPLINQITGVSQDPLVTTEVNYDNIMRFFSTYREGFTFSFDDDNNLLIDIDGDVLDASLFGLDLSSLGNLSLKIDLTPDESSDALIVTFQDINVDGYIGDITVKVKAVIPSTPSSFGFNSDAGVVDLSEMPLLVKVGLATTRTNKYSLSGTLYLKTSGIASRFVSADITANVYCYIRVSEDIDEVTGLYKVDGYIKITCDKPIDGGGTFDTSRTQDKLVTEFFIKDKNCYIKRAKKSYKSTRKYIWNSWGSRSLTSQTYEYQKTTQQFMTENAFYMVIAYALDDEDLYDQIMDAMNLSEDTDPLSYISSFKRGGDLDTNTGSFQGIFKVSLITAYVDIGYDKSSYILKRVHAYSDFNILIASVKMDLDLYNRDLNDSSELSAYSAGMTIFDSFTTARPNDSHTSSLSRRESLDQTGSSYIYSSSSNIF
jgi:hypothetical protein